MKKLVHRSIGLVLALTMLLAQLLVPMPLHANAAEQNVSASAQSTANRDIQDGVTLHCWNWSFANIEANMAAIAEAGYTAVQTSPVQPLKETTVDQYGTYSGKWWVYYQPTDFCIDNDTTNALGTKADFEKMCATAEKYGIKVIVDVVANHLANATGLGTLSSEIPADIRNDTSCWHDIKTNTTNYSDRYNITQYCMSDLPDLNTGSAKIQKYVLDFLKECVDAGADGFRFDAAKHIETPQDTYCASNFWPTVINGIKSYAPGVYCYGEVLDNTGGVAISAYTQYMSVTDNQWSDKVRENVISSGSASNYYYSYDKGATADKLVLWAESHDTYANKDGASKDDSDMNINKTWALVASRADAMGLYLARPSTMSQKLGVASKTAWSWDEVAAVNKFHNAFVGQGEYVTNNNGYVCVERGTSGAVIVNVGSNGNVNIPVNKMANGKYTDLISGNVFTVSNGQISGKITHQCGYVVLYNECDHSWVAGTTTNATCTTDGVKNYSCSKCGGTKSEVVAVAPGHKYVNDVCSVCGTVKPQDYTLYFDNASNWSAVNIYYWSDANNKMVEWPGVAMKSEGDGIYSYSVPLDAEYVIFNDGNTQTDDLDIPGDNYLFTNDAWKPYVVCDHPSHDQSGICTSCGQATAHNYVSGTCTICGVAKPSDKTIYFDNSNNWSKVYIYYWNDGDISYTVWPGELMNKYDGSIYSFTVPGDANKVIFHNNSGDDVPSSNKTADLDIEGNLYTMSTGKWSTMNTCNHSYSSVVTKEATCETAGVKTYTCSKCSDSYTETIAASGHKYTDGVCTVCGDTKPVVTMPDYYLFGWINNKNYACEDDSNNMGEYKLVNGTLTTTFANTAYVAVKSADNKNWYMTKGYPGDTATSAVLYSTSITGTESNKLRIPGGVKVTITLVDNGDGSFTLSYAEYVEGCTHSWKDATCTAPKTCTKCGANEGKALGHSWKDATCTAPKTCSKCGATEGEALKHDYQSAVTAPTCTKEGYTTYTCSACGDNYKSDTVPATGEHNYVDGTCTGCGAAQPVKLPVLEPTGATLSLEGEVMYKVYFKIDDASSIKSMGMLTFNSQPANGNIENADEVISKVELVNGTYIASSNGIPAKMLGDEVYICLYAQLEDGTYVYSRVIKYSGKIYADYMLDYRSDDPALQKVVVAMLNYGAEAQTFFGYKTDSLMNADLTESEKNMIVDYNSTLVPSRALPDAGKTSNFPKSEQFSYRSASMVLEGALAINYRFVPSLTPASGLTLYYWTEDTYNSVDALSLDNIDGQMTMEQDASGYYTATYDGLAAKQMGDVIYIAAVYESNGETHTTGVIAYSLYTYCNDAVTYKQPSAEIAKAAAVYGYYAESYFGN